MTIIRNVNEVVSMVTVQVTSDDNITTRRRRWQSRRSALTSSIIITIVSVVINIISAMLRANDEDVESDQLAALSAGGSSAGAGRPGSRAYHWRQQGLAARRWSPTSIDSALSRLAASVTAIRAYLTRLKQLEQWLNDRLKAIDTCLGRVRRIEKVVVGLETSPPLPGDCPPHLLLVTCYADLARQALHGQPDGETSSQQYGWSSTSGDQSDGDVKTSLTPDCLFGPLHDAAMAAGLAVLAATDQRVPAAALQVEGTEAAATSSTSATDSLTTEQQREYTSLMSILPPVKKAGRRLGDLLSLLTKSLYNATRDVLMGDVDNTGAERRQQAAGRVLEVAELRSFTDFVANSRPIVRLFLLPPNRRLVLSSVEAQPRGADACSLTVVHEAPSVLMEQLVDVVCADITRRFQTETYGAHVVLGQLTRRLDTAPREVDGAVELARELETHAKLLEMSSRYDNIEALTQSLITCAVERVRTQTTSIIDKWKSACLCRSIYHVVVE